MGTSLSSGVQSAGGVIFAGRNRVNAITILTDGTNAATLELYDNATTNSGTVRVKGKCVGASLVNHIIFENPVLFSDGIYAGITGIGASYIVFFGG